MRPRASKRPKTAMKENSKEFQEDGRKSRTQIVGGTSKIKGMDGGAKAGTNYKVTMYSKELKEVFYMMRYWSHATQSEGHRRLIFEIKYNSCGESISLSEFRLL